MSHDINLADTEGLSARNSPLSLGLLKRWENFLPPFSVSETEITKVLSQ